MSIELGLREVAIHKDASGNDVLWARLTPDGGTISGCAHDGSDVYASFSYSFSSQRGKKARYQVLSHVLGGGPHSRPIRSEAWSSDAGKAGGEMVRTAIAHYEERKRGLDKTAA